MSQPPPETTTGESPSRGRLPTILVEVDSCRRRPMLRDQHGHGTDQAEVQDSAAAAKRSHYTRRHRHRRKRGFVHRSGTRTLAVVLAVLLLGCKDSGPGAPSPPPAQTPTIQITASGVSPKTIEVPLGSRVLFVNNDNREHYMHSDPHPEGTDCPELNQVGFLNPNQSRETGNLVEPGTCGFHDHIEFNDASLRGQITIR